MINSESEIPVDILNFTTTPGNSNILKIDGEVARANRQYRPPPVHGVVPIPQLSQYKQFKEDFDINENVSNLQSRVSKPRIKSKEKVDKNHQGS